jgi:hypothetical protein
MNSAPDIQTHPASNCSLRIEMRLGDRPLSVGTAFVVKTPVGHLLVTSRQNVTGYQYDSGDSLDRRAGAVPDRIVVWHHRAFKPGHWRPVVQALRDRDDKPLWIEHPTWGAKADIVAIRLMERAVGALDPLAFHPYDILDRDPDLDFQPADRVSVVGFPLDLKVAGFNPVWSTGYIASEPQLDVQNLPVVLLDCRANQGLSGAPVISTQGQGNTKDLRLLGVYGGRVDSQSDIARVWKTSAVVELLETAGPFYGDIFLNGAIAQQPAWLDFAGDLFNP